MTNLRQICNHEQCTGCAACFNACRHNAIRMMPDEEGFLRPSITSEACVGCGLCVKVCPVNSEVKRHKAPLFVYSGWSKDDAVRLSSASGGGFMEIALYFINVMHGVVFGVAMNDKLEACHIAVSESANLKHLQGSKYIQSKIGDTYRQAEYLLKEGRKVLYSGTPCQIAGLKNFLRKEYDNLFTVDLICHGVPSKRVFDDYVKYLEKRLGHRVYDVKFRCKKSSWIFFNMAVNSHVEKKSHRVSYEYEGAYYSDPFIRAFLRDNALRPSCYQCKYTSTSRVSDFTLADWWGYKADGAVDHDFEKKGVSLIFVNTGKVSGVVNSMNLLLKNQKLSDALKTNISLQHPFEKPISRDDFWCDYFHLDFEEVLDKWFYPERLKPSSYVRYKISNPFAKFVLLFLSRVYEKSCRLFKLDVMTISA